MTVKYDLATVEAAVHCPACRRLRPRDAFYGNAAHANGLQTHCKECQRGLARLTPPAPDAEKVSNRQRAFAEFAKGARVCEVRDRVGVSQHSAQALHTAYLQKIGSPRIHHGGKKQMIDRLLRGRSDLKIYESCSYMDDGKIGVCRVAYEKYGTVTGFSKKHGDWTMVLRVHLITQEGTYDVVDVDGYRGPEPMLLNGVVRLLRPNGLLILTWPSPTDYARHIGPQVEARMFYGTTRPSVLDYEICATRLCRLHGYAAKRVDYARYGNMHRVALRVHPVTVHNGNYKQRVAEVGDLFPVHDPNADNG
jgi:hypothetical protein